MGKSGAELCIAQSCQLQSIVCRGDRMQWRADSSNTVSVITGLVESYQVWSTMLCVGVTGCSEELIALTQSLLSLDWLNHIKYGPLCCLVPHVGVGVCLRLCPSLPHDILAAFNHQSITAAVCHFSMLSLIIYLYGCVSFSFKLCWWHLSRLSIPVLWWIKIWTVDDNF